MGGSDGSSVCGSAGSPWVFGVFDVLDSPWLVGDLGGNSLSVSDCEFVVPQSFSRKRRASHIESQGDVNMASSPEDVQRLSRRRTQEVDCGVDQKWAAVYQSVARRMLSYLNHSEMLKVNTRELEYHVLATYEPRVDIEHLVRQARGEQHQRLFQIFSRQGATEILVASVARWKEHQRMLIVLERRCLDLSEAVEKPTEKQELLTTLCRHHGATPPHLSNTDWSSCVQNRS